MGEKAEYKSAKRSRRMIREAFLELLQEKDIEKITVTDIVNRADLNRGTFYAHYQDIHAVILEIEDEIINKMLGILDEFNDQNFVQNPMPLLAKVAADLEENKDFYRILLNTNGSGQFVLRLEDLLIQYTEKHVEIPDSMKNLPDFSVRPYFFAAGIANVYLAWLRGSLDKSLAEISQVIGDLVSSTYLMLINGDK